MSKISSISVFEVETDHKPLGTIFKKPLDKCPVRLQRLRMTLQNYSFTVRYKPGSQLYFADALSRSSYNDKSFTINEADLGAQVNLIEFNGDISKTKLDLIREETLKSIELQFLLKIINEGWPDKKSKVN